MIKYFYLLVLTMSFPWLSAQVNLTNGLVFHLPLDNNTLDIGPNSINGVGQNLLVAQNRFGSKMKAAKFDGAVNDGVITLGSPLMNNLTNYSVSYWFRIDQNTNAMSLVGQDNSFETGYYTGPNRVITFHPSYGSFSFPVSNPSGWNHVVITGNNTALKCYLNGNLVRTENGNFTAVNTTNNFNIGGNVVNQSNISWLRGSIDDVRLYDRVITLAEIDALYNSNSVQVVVDAIDDLTPCAGQTIQVDFTASGNILPGNQYLLEISDLNGNYIDNIEIGVLQSSALTGTITGTIPEGIPSGSAYTVRVSSTNIMSSGLPSSQTLTIQGVVGDIPDPSLFRFVGESNNRLYYRSLNNGNYSTAVNNCMSNGGHLANVGDQQDQNLLYSYIGSQSAWIALNDDVNSGALIWANDFTTAYNSWQPGQPGNDNHVVMRVDNGRWNGLSAGQSRDYFLQLEPAGLNVSECDGGDIMLIPGSIPGATYSWSGPNGFNSSNENPTLIGVSTSDAGIYNLTITNNTCSASVSSVTLTVDPLSTNKIVETSTPDVCEGSSGVVYVLNTETAYDYALFNLTTSNQIGASQTGNGDTLFFSTAALTDTTSFEIRAQDPLTGCQRWMDDTITINVLALPTPPSTVGDNVCNGGQLTLFASGGAAGDMYTWYDEVSMGNVLQSGTNTTYQTDSIGSSTSYFVTLTDQNGCESNATSVLAEVILPLSPEVDLTSGLILHYTFEGNAQDQSGNNINANISGSNSAFVDDRFQNPTSALNLDGATFLNSGNPSQVQALTNQVTISLWIKQTPSNWGFQTPLLNKWQNNGLYLGLDSYLAAPNQPNENRVRWRVNNGTVVNSNTNVPHNQWHHIVCTFNGAQLRVYQNGVLTGQANHSGTITNTITNLQFGRLANGLGSVFYRGDVDDIRLYNRALNLAEVQSLYNSSVAFANNPLCEGDDLSLSSLAFPGAVYSWTGPNGFISSDQNPAPISNVDSLLHSGVYSLEVARYGCTSLPQKVEVIINSTPEITAVMNDTVCGPSNATLSAVSSNPNATFLWYTTASGGSPIAAQNASQLVINNVTQNEIRYVSVVLNDCESQRVPVSVVYYDDVDPNLTLSGDATLCENEDYMISINSSELDVEYEVLLNGSSTGLSAIGTGADLVLTIPAAQLILGSNTLEVSASTQGCSDVILNNQLAFVVTATPQATITSNTGNGDICNGQSIDLIASGGSSYLWSGGEMVSTITVSSANNYTVTVTDNNGCQSTSLPFTVQEINLNVPVIDTIGNTTFCDGDSVELIANGFTNYLWSTGAPTSSIVVSSSGTFTVEVQEASCVETSAPVTVTVFDLPNTGSIIGNTQLSCAATDEVYAVSSTIGSSYLWSVPPGASITSGQGTNQITVDFNGNFGVITVLETNEFGCKGDMQTLDVECNLSAVSFNIPSPHIYPNPSSDFLTIETFFDNVGLKLFDATGKLVLSSRFSEQHMFDIHQLFEGVYYGVLTFDNGHLHNFKIVKLNN